MKGIWQDYPRVLHLEPTRNCNARCPQCIRTFENTLDTMPNLNIDEIRPEWISDKLKNDIIFSNVESVLLNGNTGDIVMHSDPKGLLEALMDNENINRIDVNTNGGGLSSNFWKWLGGITKKQILVIFAVDGFEDTHSLYRRNTRFEIVIKNLTTYIKAGGNANVAININGNNEHEIEDLKIYLKKLGVTNIFTRYNERFNTDYIVLRDKDYKEDQILYSAEKRYSFIPHITANELRTQWKKHQNTFPIDNFYNSFFVMKKKKNERFKKDKFYNIQCQALGGDGMINLPNFYMSADGRIWECCYLEIDYLMYALFGKYSSFIDKYYYEIKDNENFNSLHHYSGEEILKLDCFSKLRERWKSNRCLEICSIKCARG